MENCKSLRVARAIAFIDQLWSAIDMLLTFVTFFGGEKVNGLFYEVELHASLGRIPEEQVTGKKALTGLLFSLSFVFNLLWIFAAFMLFKGTEPKQLEGGKRRPLTCCRMWFCFSIVLLSLHLVNVFIYIEESLQEVLAVTAFFTRASFMYLVRQYMNDLLKFIDSFSGPNTRQLIYIHREEGEPPSGPRERNAIENGPENEDQDQDEESARMISPPSHTSVTISTTTATDRNSRQPPRYNFSNGKSVRIES